jgi:hypothetical protein
MVAVTRSSPLVRLLIAACCLGVLCTLSACGLLGGNGDDGDGGKFPEPPDRPSSAHVVTPESGPDAVLAVRIDEIDSPSIPVLRPNS